MMEINVDNLMKELRLVEGSQKMIAVALKMEEVPLPVIEKVTGFDKKAVYRLYNQLSSRLTSKLLIEVKRAVLYASIKFKVYKCLGVVVVTMGNDIPPSKFRMFPPTRKPEDIRSFMDKGMFERVRLEDTVYGNKTFSQLLSE